MRVPGIGPMSARRIAAERRENSIRSLADLRKLGVVTTRAAGFLTLGGRRLQTTRWTQQLGFWAPEDEVGAPTWCIRSVRARSGRLSHAALQSVTALKASLRLDR